MLYLMRTLNNSSETLGGNVMMTVFEVKMEFNEKLSMGEMVSHVNKFSNNVVVEGRSVSALISVDKESPEELEVVVFEMLNNNEYGEMIDYFEVQ